MLQTLVEKSQLRDNIKMVLKDLVRSLNSTGRRQGLSEHDNEALGSVKAEFY
jgi:hypothetical protein